MTQTKFLTEDPITGNIVQQAVADTDISGTTTGAIPFVSSGAVLAEDTTKLNWDNTNNRLGVGAGGAASSDATLTLNNNNGASAAPGGGTMLHLVQADATANRVYLDTFGGGVNVMTNRQAGGTRVSPAALATTNMFSFSVQGYNGSAYVPAGSFLFVTTNNPYSGTATGCAWTISTTASGTTGAVETGRFDAGTGFSMYGTNPVIDQNRLHVFRAYATASLPTGVNPYSKAFVNDSMVGVAAGLGLAPIGSGSNKVPVYTVDGTNWLIG